MEFDKEKSRYEMTLPWFEPWARLLISQLGNQKTLFPVKKTFKELGNLIPTKKG